MDFVAIDFETTGLGKAALGCEIGLVKVIDDRIVDRYSSLIFQESMSPESEKIHGISLAELSSAPRIEEIMHDVANFIGTMSLVAHNARFDGGVLKAMGIHIHLTANDIYCSYLLSRKLIPEGPHKLEHLVARFDIVNAASHRALGDAEATAKLAIELVHMSKATDLKTAFRSNGLRQGRISKIGFMPPMSAIGGKTHTNSEIRGEMRDSIAEDDFKIHPDWDGQEVLFTGEFESMSRNEAELLAMKLGAFPKSSVNKKTKFVVVGSDPGPAKLEKVDQLRANGSEIRTLNESDFLQAIEEAPEFD